MVYLSAFTFPDADAEWAFAMSVKRKCYDTFYPFGVLAGHQLTRLDFEPVTILYGGNGSGKSTALNVMAHKLQAARDTRYNRSNFFEDYVDRCRAYTRETSPEDTRIITSDDVFDFMLNLRAANEGIDERREELFDEWLHSRYDKFQLRSMADYEQLKRVNQARSNTQSRYVRKNLVQNVREHSNGESAFLYFTDKLHENGLYLLDEPENSLSPERQQALVQHLEEQVRFFGCQLIIATHSPFLLSMRGAKIYDLDADPVRTARWTELANVRAYHDFFRDHAAEFGD